jgi:endonuclease/exonuclease/phosphatase family metal-dependent hydrolase
MSARPNGSSATPARRSRLAAGFAVALLGAVLAPAFAGGLPPGQHRKLTVLTFNIKGLPWPLSSNDGRFQRIAEILKARRAAGNAPDLVFLQEDFSPASKVLRKQAGFKRAVRGPHAAVHLLGSGLTVLSDLPIRSVVRERFGSACSDTDCLAEKGILALEVDLGPEWGSIWVANTHLQAHRAFERSREQQMSVAVEFLRRETGFSSAPIIFAGDFNVRPDLDSYRYFLSIAPFQDVARICLDRPDTCKLVADENGQAVVGDVWQTAHDRQFIYNPVRAPAEGGLTLTPTELRLSFTEAYPGRFQNGYLSDHWGYEVDYMVSRR